MSRRFPNPPRRPGPDALAGLERQYAWDKLRQPDATPYDQDPPQGWLGTANHRTVPRGYGMQLSNSWFYPERAERIAELAATGRP